MGKAEFEESLRGGGHKALAGMAGSWEGRTRVWFEPDKPPVMDVAQQGEASSILGGRFLLHQYRYGEGEQAGEGAAIYGLHLDEQASEHAWVDTFHTNTSILFSKGAYDGGEFKASASYADGKGGPPWGWRTELSQPSADAFVITMFNILPDGTEAKAVETCYRRTG